MLPLVSRANVPTAPEAWRLRRPTAPRDRAKRGSIMEKTTFVNLPDVFWFAEDNVARAVTGHFRKEGDRSTVAVAMFPGWNQNKSGPLIVRPLSDEEKSEALRRLSSSWEALKAANLSDEPLTIRIDDANVSVSLADQCRVFEQIFTKNGKLITPKYAGVTGYRRGESWLLASTLRAKRNLEPAIDLPVIVREYKNKQDQYADNVLENAGKMDAAMAMSSADVALACILMVELGASESDLQKSLGGPSKRGTAQKMFALARLNGLHPKLDVKAAVKAGTIKIPALDKEAMRKMAQEDASAEDVKAYLENPKKEKNQKKAMGRPAIERLKENNPCIAVKMVCQAILNDDATVLRELTLNAAKLNEFLESIGIK